MQGNLNFRGLTHGFVFRENEKVIGNQSFYKMRGQKESYIFIRLEWREEVEENVW